jgi:hypothetical protein
VIEFTDTLLQKIEKLLNLQVGDLSRLTYIQKMILNNKPLYTTDQQYVESLINKYIKNTQLDTEINVKETKEDIQCWNCRKDISELSNYCSFCGITQNKQVIKKKSFLSNLINHRFNPLYHIINLNSYQIIAVIGGLAALLPILAATSRMEDIVFSIESYTGKDSSYLFNIFRAAGITSSILSCIVIVITFVIKKPKRIARILFFTAFAILITSIMIGIVGFALILWASIIAFKKRRY